MKKMFWGVSVLGHLELAPHLRGLRFPRLQPPRGARAIRQGRFHAARGASDGDDSRSEVSGDGRSSWKRRAGKARRSCPPRRQSPRGHPQHAEDLRDRRQRPFPVPGGFARALAEGRGGSPIPVRGLETRGGAAWPEGWKRGMEREDAKDAEAQRNPISCLRLCAFAFFLDLILFPRQSRKGSRSSEERSSAPCRSSLVSPPPTGPGSIPPRSA